MVKFPMKIKSKRWRLVDAVKEANLIHSDLPDAFVIAELKKLKAAMDERQKKAKQIQLPKPK